MSPANLNTRLQFLAGGGEMGGLTREKDWSKTPVGDPNHWPQSLRTTLNIVLNSRFPMFLWWGPELICFYNDAYRASLGNNGKHPGILGLPAKEAWPEVWDVIKPLIEQVVNTGEATWSEDMLVPIFRNGKIEDVYWTFSYSPVHDESGKIAGVLSTCTETTGKVQQLAQIKESEERFRNMVKQAPVGIAIFTGSEFIAETANETYLQLIDKKESDFFGKPLFVSLPEVRTTVEPLLTDVMKTGEPYYGNEFPVMLNRFGQQKLAYFDFVYHPLRGQDGKVSGVIVVATDVTASVSAKQFLAESGKQFRNMVMQSPIPMTIFRGKEHIVEMANTIMFEKIWRKKPEEVIGRKILDVFPELNDQKYPELLREVYTTGKIHSEKESIAFVQGEDGMKKFYLDFEYAPLLDTDGNTSGIIITVNDVTEKVEARILIEENEKQYRSIAERLNIVIEASELGTWEWNIHTGDLEYSDGYLQIFGYAPGTKVDHPSLIAQIHPEDRAARDIAHARALRTGILDLEMRIIRKDGSIHWIEAKGKVFYDAQKNPLRLVGTIRETTQEKNRERELLENEQRFRLLADSMPQHIWTADPEGNLNYYNQSVFDYTGLTLEQIDVDGLLQLVHPDDREENIRQWKESVNTGKDFLFEHRFRRHDGVYRWQLSRAIAQRDAAGNIQMWVGSSTDIEEQKTFTNELEKQVRERTAQLVHSNESLARSEERYHMMVEEVDEYAILYLNREGIVENWNKGAEKIKGYTAEEIVGRSFSVFYPEAEKKAGLPERLLQQAVEKGKAIHEGWRVRKDGSQFWASVAITAIHDAQDNVIGFSKVTHDLTEKKAADDKLKASAALLEKNNKDLQKMNAELQSFAYVSSHDLQEPLRKIQTFASRILSKEIDSLSETARDYFNRMQEAAGRMQTLIQDLLAYSRTNTSDRPLENIDLTDIVNEVKADIREMHTEKNVVIEVGSMVRVNVIPFQFRQILYNLIGNAIKFARAGVPPHVRIESRKVKGSDVPGVTLSPDIIYNHISVADNGIGFEPQYRERIFEVFQRLHGKDEYSGTGIGLAIVKKIIDNHNGVIIASGELGQGATFDMYVPE